MNKTYYVAGIAFDDESALKHYRTPGSKNGVRKYQNPDGSLTPLGRIHYGVGQAREGYGPITPTTGQRYTINTDKKYAKQLQKSLNKADQEAAYVIGDYNKHNRGVQRYNNKIRKLVEKNTDVTDTSTIKGRNFDKLAKYTNKARQHKEAAESAMSRLKEIESQQWKLMGEAADRGYSVLSTPKYRSTVRNGEQAFNAIMFGGIGAGIKQVYDYGTNGNYTEGHKFKVRS